MPPREPLLQRHVVVADAPLDRARPHLLSALGARTVVRADPDLRLDLARVLFGPEVALTWIATTGRLDLQGVPRRGRVAIWLHRSGSAEHRTGALAVRSSPHLGVVVAPDTPVELRASPLEALVVDLADHRLHPELDRRRTHLRDLSPLASFDPVRGAGHALLELLGGLARDLDRRAPGLAPDTSAGERWIATLLALVGDVLGAPSPEEAEVPDSLRRVQRVEAWLEDHLGERLRVADLARIAGVTTRSLQKDFAAHRDCSPLQALRRRRLRAVHEALLHGGPDTTVTDTALASGFTHMGRFSGAYAEVYGERPSETLARARGGSDA